MQSSAAVRRRAGRRNEGSAGDIGEFLPGRLPRFTVPTAATSEKRSSGTSKCSTTGTPSQATGSLRIGGLDCAPKRARRCQYGRGLSQNIGQRLIAFATARIDQQEVQCDSPWAHGGDTLDQTCEGGARERIRSGLAHRLVVNGDDGDQVGCGSFPLD